MKKAPVLKRAQRANSLAVPPQFFAVRRTASGYNHILRAVTGAPGVPTSERVGIAAPEGNSERLPDRLAPPGGSLHRETIFLLGLLHRTAIIVRSGRIVKSVNREKTNEKKRKKKTGNYGIDRGKERDIMTAFLWNKVAGGAVTAERTFGSDPWNLM